MLAAGGVCLPRARKSLDDAFLVLCALLVLIKIRVVEAGFGLYLLVRVFVGQCAYVSSCRHTTLRGLRLRGMISQHVHAERLASGTPTRTLM